MQYEKSEAKRDETYENDVLMHLKCGICGKAHANDLRDSKIQYTMLGLERTPQAGKPGALSKPYLTEKAASHAAIS